MERKISFHTLGCKVNQYETEALKERFAAAGFSVVPEGEKADVYIINTCTVTNLADRKSRQFIRRAIKDNPKALIVATGCYVQIKPEEAAAIPGVDLIVGINEKSKILEYVEKALKEGKGEETAEKHILSYEELSEYRSDGIISAMEGKSRAFIKIEEGCNRFCSYCIIPFARGRVRSRPLEEIIQEGEALVKAGFKEIVLTGINTALYGTDLGMGGIEPLLGKMEEMEGDFRIRLSSLEPTVIDWQYVKKLLQYERLCHHLHLSLQSGSDQVLKAMNRRYSGEEFLRIVDVVRALDPFYGISSDVIVGFPGETEKDFEDSLDLIRRGGIDRVHGFKYSKRQGTKAAAMENQVDEKVKQERISILTKVGEEVSLDRRREMEGAKKPVLFEEIQGGLLTGYTDNYIRVYVDLPEEGEELIGEIRNVTLGNPWKDGVKGNLV